jgi:hypothetical protein
VINNPTVVGGYQTKALGVTSKEFVEPGKGPTRFIMVGKAVEWIAKAATGAAKFTNGALKRTTILDTLKKG